MTDKFDVLVIGAGAAGLYTALCLPEHLHVGLINKNIMPVSASDWAQGGIAAAIAPEDSAALHVQDTLAAGAGLCDLEAVQFLVEEAAACIDSLVKMGVAFDRTGPDLALTLEAAHSRRRVLHSADTTGKAVVSTLTAKVLNRKNIQLVSPAFALSLWLDKTGRCQGISSICDSQVKWLRASAVVLATGGGGQVFAQTTNPSVSTGDGVAIAWRAGALLRDLEFVQFHPTALSKAGAPRFLISEAVRGEGAHLVDSKGYRFAFDSHPSGELAPRDVVSRAIFRHLQKTGEPHVWLDLRPIDCDRLRYRFPNIIQVCADWGIDIFAEPVPVTPAAHYWMGGIVADKFNQTSIPGLYAVGETASTGVHGANRLASNSLLECLVFGAQMGLLQLEGKKSEALPEEEDAGEILEKSVSQQDIEAIEKLRIQLPSLVWQSAGICRGQRDLESAIVQVEMWRQEFSSLALSQALDNLRPGQTIDFSPADAENSSVLRNWGEVGNLLDIGYLILKSAAFRTESRGGHYRLDYPLTDRDWCSHTLINQSHWYKSGPIEY
ncbi:MULTISPECIES: L-aspartate oxidase [unclassified Microcoleus]|uniref:L-aspartate oxidase n=1 Tax=unclassified Microcoleus TaxID=2642155 RepID=UPI001D31595F|nr:MULTISPECIES: L-aspartate oxidase [unclassified Microcoleus]TAG88649.1 MAG: L-aspartate oxidase [Oscillatoriales cyanobacterium]MCC3474744.1 L-aspartate oxidase [Microcoleus sp. PH2017_13_LAR_U_A]MCC3487262.1 L-aspartate oxidase [Microcoleus sp. PH2017_14_LAR_D_A]MCC3526140.1 L-aspartate oxidase [Microcoleus sp. PH2017_20_SFW_D_A]MCC3557154.1 L-aspartate oxidase [Microcoleus sp. PH2017_35_SFW_U_B]